MFLQIIFIFMVCATSNSLLFAAKLSIAGDVTDEIANEHLPFGTVKANPLATASLSADNAPRPLSYEERSILFKDDALQQFSSERQDVYLYFDVKKDFSYADSVRVYCEKDPLNKPFVTLRLESESDAVVRQFTFYEAARVGFLRCIKNSRVQKTPLCIPELGIMIKSLLTNRRALVTHEKVTTTNNGPWSSFAKLDSENDDPPLHEEEDSGQKRVPWAAWEYAATNTHLRYVATNSLQWSPGVVRIVVGQTALTGYLPEVMQSNADYTRRDGSAFFEAVEQLKDASSNSSIHGVLSF